MPWKVGDYAIANIKPRKFEKIRIMKIRTVSDNKAGRESETFYYVCVCDRKEFIWLPKEKVVTKKTAAKRTRKRRRRRRRAAQVIDVTEHIQQQLPVDIQQPSTSRPDINISFEQRQTAKTNNRKDFFNEYVKFISRKRSIRRMVAGNDDTLMSPDGKKDTISHITWCIVCGEVENIQECNKCPASFHPRCERIWVINKISSENKDKTTIMKMPVLVDLIRSITTCPSCVYGPDITYGDIIWHKNASDLWWPAKILKPGTVPPCLLKTKNTSQGHWPVLYYNENKYCWVATNSVCPFFPVHYDAVKGTCKLRNDAINEACHDYIYTYTSK